MCKMMMVITRCWYDYQLKTRCKLKGWSRTCYFEVLWYYKYVSVQIFQNIQKKVMWKIWMKAQRSETGMVAQWLLRALKGRVCAPSREVEVSIPSCCSYHETAPMALLWHSHWAPHLGREVRKKMAQGSGAMNILRALGRGCVMRCWWLSTVGSLWVDSIPNELTGLAQFPEAGSFAD